MQANKLKLEFEKLSTEQQLMQQQEAAEYAHTQQLDFEKEKRKLELEYQQQLVQKDDTIESSTTTASVSVAKMPKLVISKFNGTPQDWFIFWG